ncbi:hypothetical protein SUGI_0099450 [Cryptomeria japonica]|nr:hypothetical protein SUGI_0099450 [Cryptomeria japonica]
MCSASVKCGVHRQSIPKPAAAANVGNEFLMRPQLSRGNYYRRNDSFSSLSSYSSPVLRRTRSVQTIIPGEVARRAVRLSCRSRGAQKIRRGDFERRPSRLSKVSTAYDY